MKCRCSLLFVIVLLMPLLLSGQTSFTESYESIISSSIGPSEKLTKVELLLQDQEEFSPTERAQVLYNFSKWCFIKLKDHKRGQKYAMQEYALRSNLLQDDNLLKRNLYNLGYMFHHTASPNYNKSLVYFNKLIEVSDSLEPRLGNTYREIGDIYDELGDFRNALNHYEKSARILEIQDHKRSLLTTYTNILGMYVDTNDSTFVRPFLKNLDLIQALEGEVEFSNRQRAMLLFNTAAMLRTSSNYRNEIEPAQEALELFKEYDDSLNIFKTLGLMGTIKKMDGDFLEAERLFDLSTQYVKNDPLNQSSIYNNLGDIALAQGMHLEAMEHYEKAVQTAAFSRHESAEYTLKDLVQDGVLPNKKHVLDYLIDQADGWFKFYESTKDRAHLLEAEKCVTLADALIDQLYFESREELSKLSWRKKGSQLYFRAVSICYLLDKSEKAFYYMEKNKGLVLLENITSVKAKELGKIPQEVIDREHMLLGKIKQVQLSFAELQKEENPAKKLKETKNVLFNLKRDYKLYVDSLKQQFPSYYSYKQQLELIGLPDLQKTLSKDENAIEYIVGANEAFGMFISKSSLELVKLPKWDEVEREIMSFQKFVRKPLTSRDEIDQFKNVAARLHKSLLPFDLYKKLPKGSKISIVTDGSLQYFPFESLLSENIEDDLRDRYLLSRFIISYNHSFSLVSKFEMLESEKKNSYLAFLPSSFLNNYVPDLLGSASEKKAISSYFGESIIQSNRATKQSFLERYNENSVIHISTHGGIDNAIPWLAFYDERLFLDELYFFKNQKAMVVLSACKTSIGEIIEGEGLLNLTRGFIKSGAKSVVSTLWDVNEKSSSEIISSFYKHLHDGEEKSVALQKAKLSYLDEHHNTSEASPYYWSSIVLTGDHKPLIDEGFPWLSIAFATLTGLFLVYLVRNRRRRAVG